MPRNMESLPAARYLHLYVHIYCIYYNFLHSKYRVNCLHLRPKYISWLGIKIQVSKLKEVFVSLIYRLRTDYKISNNKI